VSDRRFRHWEEPSADRVGNRNRSRRGRVPGQVHPGNPLVNELVEAADEMTLTRTIARYDRVDLLCIDELGYTELDKCGADLLFQVLTEREEKSSVTIASNGILLRLDQDLIPAALGLVMRPEKCDWSGG
jgi:hypothetical protein